MDAVFPHTSDAKPISTRWWGGLADDWGSEMELMPSGWYFWDEIWTQCYGPFISEKEAKTELAKYLFTIDNGVPAPEDLTPSPHLWSPYF